ncbi:MAG: GAF domain-containing sensor histidine kinase, partial [Anaerolineae bacterium]|nr:GAF domain-containing sensor histidine kinase [Anaerolineae bacterium]
TILEPEKLLSTVVPQIKDRFDLYHVHVYTLDEEAGELVMRFGSGEPGRIMREDGHKISLLEENSLVAQAARTGNPVVVNDVTQDPNFMPNPLLPDTRSEVAVPVSIGGQILGVVDVQDDEPDRFTKSDINVFTTLAAQIAAALQNARLFNEIQLTADRLREVDRLKSEFLANMSHELRTPMNSILGYTEVLLMGIDGDLDPEMLQDVEAIYENGQHLLRLINDVLDLAKIEAGRMSLTMEEVYVDLLLDEVKTSNIGLLHKRQTPVEFVVEAEEDLPPIQADRIRLSQILNNLVSNAVKFTEKGYIWLRAYQDDSWVCIEVEDTGIGISQEDMGKLFERFQQVDGSTTRRAEGTGLGLSITRHLVEMHGGKIEVFSDVDQGSKFLIRLPIPGSAPDPDPEAVIE